MILLFKVLRTIFSGRYLSRFAISWSDYEAVTSICVLMMEGLVVMDHRSSETTDSGIYNARFS